MLNKLRQLNRQYFLGRRVSPQQLTYMRDSLMEESIPDLNYVVLLLGSCAIATFGLLSNSAAVIIGAMIVAPLMLPIRGIAFGALEGDLELFRKGLIAVSVGTIVSVLLSVLIGMMIGLSTYGTEVLARSRPTLLDLGVAVAAGGISGFAKVQPKVSNALAGTAIAVALMPPICVVGLGVAQLNWRLSLGAGILYLTNLFGITLSCMMIFLAAGYTPLARARKPVALTTLMTSLLLIPLGISLVRLVNQVQLETSLRQALLGRTITFQRVQLLSSETNWLSTPPEVRLFVSTQEAITPYQVGLLEDFIAQEMGRSFTLIFEITELQEVRREEPPAE
ncbi:DUF389 domain-containing protein [Oculatella sp. LEGE 06141]|nr:DUF389 domain-containing protein [Oculatella sp. LEGE 06141]